MFELKNDCTYYNGDNIASYRDGLPEDKKGTRYDLIVDNNAFNRKSTFSEKLAREWIASGACVYKVNDWTGKVLHIYGTVPYMHTAKKLTRKRGRK